MKALKIQAYKQLSRKVQEFDVISFFSTGLDSKIQNFLGSFYKHALKKVARYNKNEFFTSISPRGIGALRQAICNAFYSNNSDLCLENIIVTNGAQQALSLLVKNLIKQQDIVLVEQTSYLGLEKPLLDKRCKIIGFPDNINALSDQDIENYINKTKPKLLYLIPDFPNPTGISMLNKKRQLLTKLSSQFNYQIIEDQTYRELVFQKEDKSPSMLSLSTNVTSISSISKFFGPNLRIGWIASRNKKLTQQIIIDKEGNDLSTSFIIQVLALEMITNHNKFITKINSHYENKMKILYKELKLRFPNTFQFSKPKGGFFIWITGPSNFNSSSILDKALNNGVSYVPGNIFYYSDDKKNTLRLSVSETPTKKIIEGVKRLTKVLNI